MMTPRGSTRTQSNREIEMTKIMGARLCLMLGALAMGAVFAPVALAAEEMALVERATTDAVVDTGASGDSAGDLLTFANDIFDKDNASKVGTDTGWCIRTVAGKSWECFWTLYLGDGQITVQGPFLDAGDSVLAITGGTGKYAGARGDMALHSRNAEGTEFDFVYRLK
jgi:hypothetical protein